MSHVVALRALKLGDLLVVVPALRAIRRAWPRHEIMLATPGWLGPVVELAGCVDTVLPAHDLAPLPEVAHRPDVAVNLHGPGPHSNTVLDALRPRRRIGHRGHGWEGPEWTDQVHERERWCRLLDWYGIPADPADLLLPPPEGSGPAPGAVLIHPGAAYGSKRWPADRFAAVARALRDDGHRLVITGGDRELVLANEVAALAKLPGGAVLAGRTGLRELAALVAGAGLVVSGDTGIAHLAYAFRTPSVTLFGPAPPRYWGPPAGGPHRTLSDGAARLGEPFADRPDPALLGVGVNDVLAAARELTAQRPGVLDELRAVSRKADAGHRAGRRQSGAVWFP